MVKQKHYHPVSQAYQDFELEIGEGQGMRYPLRVLYSPAGLARGWMDFPFDEVMLEHYQDKLQIALLRSTRKRRGILSTEEKAVQEFGRSLFDSVMSGELRSLYDVSRERAANEEAGLRLKLRIQDPGLAMLPWEYLYDPRQAEYVCLSLITPVVRYIEVAKTIKPMKVNPPIRILGVAASPRDLEPLNVTQEKLRMEGALKNLRKAGWVSWEWLEKPTWRELQRALRKEAWHIFHFAGHGGYDTQAGEGMLALADEAGNAEYLSASQLALLLGDRRSLRMVILNACETGLGNKGATPSGVVSNADIFSSSATKLVERGIPAVLAMQYPISDRAALELIHAFYEAVADGLPVDAALSEGRKAVKLAYASTLEWGVPVLYMRSPDGVLFNFGGSSQPGAPSKPKKP